MSFFVHPRATCFKNENLRVKLDCCYFVILPKSANCMWSLDSPKKMKWTGNCDHIIIDFYSFKMFVNYVAYTLCEL